MSRERERYHAYQEWCHKHRKPELLFWSSILGMGDTFYRDGIVYKKRKRGPAKPVGKHIPIMQFGGSEIALRWERRFDFLAIEAMRWKLLVLAKEKFLPRLTETMIVFKGKGTLHAHNLKGVLCAYKYMKHSWPGVETDPVKLEGLDLLTRLAFESSPTDEAQQMVTAYEKAKARHWRCLGFANRLTDVLHQMLVEIIRATQKDPYDHSLITVTLNGRHYPVSSATRNPDPTGSWPSPYHQHMNLDDPKLLQETTKKLDNYRHPDRFAGRKRRRAAKKDKVKKERTVVLTGGEIVSA